MTPPCDANTLYPLCMSADPAERRRGFQLLGRCLLPIARSQLNTRYDDTIVQDCVQEALVQIWSQIKAGTCPQTPLGFLALATQITRRRCIDRHRYEQRRTAEAIDETDEDAYHYSQALGIDPSQWPEQVYLEKERWLSLILVIQSHPELNENAKFVLIEGFIFEKTDDELAKLLQMTKANIRLIRFRALKLLRNDSAFLDRFGE